MTFQLQYSALEKKLQKNCHDLNAWAETLRLMQGSRQIPEFLQDHDVSVLLNAWRTDPNNRMLMSVVLPKLGLAIGEMREEPGTLWIERGVKALDHWYDKITGFPLDVRLIANGSKMVYIPAGFAILGKEDDLDESMQYIDAFLIGRDPVLQMQYQAFAESRRFKKFKDLEETAKEHLRPQDPAEYLPWERAEAYAKSVGARLPTASEWEKAATGNVRRAYPWGNDNPVPTTITREGRAMALTKRLQELVAPKDPLARVKELMGMTEQTVPGAQKYLTTVTTLTGVRGMTLIYEWCSDKKDGLYAVKGVPLEDLRAANTPEEFTHTFQQTYWMPNAPEESVGLRLVKDLR